MKRVYKYGTGDAIPEGAVYCGTVTQTEREVVDNTAAPGYPQKHDRKVIPCWLVWHYFLVDVKD